MSAVSTPPQTEPVADNAFVQSSHVPSAQGDQHTQRRSAHSIGHRDGADSCSPFDSEGNPTLGENAEGGESRAAIAAVCAGLGVFFVGGLVVAECAGRSDTRTEDPEAKSKGSDVSKKSLRDQMLFTRKKFA